MKPVRLTPIYSQICGLTLLLWSLVGCGATETPPPLPPADLVQQASKQLVAAKSLHFEIELTGKLAYIDRPPTTALKRVEGDLLRPDRLRGLVKVSSFGLISEIGLISLAGQHFVTNPLNQQWEPLPAEWGWYFDPRLPFDAELGIPAIAPQIEFTQQGLETLDSGPAYRLEGVAQGRQLTAWSAGLIADGDVPLTLWIDPATFQLRQVQMIELSTDPERPTTWLIRFDQWDEPVEINLPPLSQE